MKEIKILGKVKDAKILQRTRQRGAVGLIIEFETSEKINDSTVVYLTYEKQFIPFNVYEVEISGDNLVGRCVEVGYFARKLGKDETLDLRDLIGCDVELVEDEKQLADIREQSCWC